MLHSVLYMGASVHVALHMDLNWDVGRIALASAVNLNHLQVRVFSNHVGVTTIERLDQGHLYPLGERRDKHVTGRARTSAPLHRRRTLYLKSYLAGYSEPLLGLRPVLHSVLYKDKQMSSFKTRSRKREIH